LQLQQETMRVGRAGAIGAARQRARRREE